MQKKLLFMDNYPGFLDVQARLLEQQGYQVLRASTLEEAEKKLQEEHIHLAILDIRMEDEDDDQDISGLLLARKEEYRSIPKIILTAHTASNNSYKYVRDALEPDLDGRPAALSFISKDEGPDVLLQAVAQAFTQRLHINWELGIHWVETHSFAGLINYLDATMACNLRRASRTDELEYLFRKLFYQHSQITMGRLFTHSPGRFTLAVFAFTKEGKEEQFVVTCGWRQSLIADTDRYARFAIQGSHSGSTLQMKREESSHFAATLYKLVAGELEELTTFGHRYHTGALPAVQAALDHLFTITLTAWYEKGRFYEEKNSWHEWRQAWLGLTTEAPAQSELEHQVAALCKEILRTGLARLDYAAHKLAFHLADGSAVFYPNPVAGLYQGQLAHDSSLLCGVTHGGIDADRILVDHSGRTWLVDFANVDQGPLLRDFVALEMTVKLDLLDATDLQARYAFEKQLLTAVDLKAAIAGDGLPAAFDKALGTVERIRHLAATLVGPNREPYLAGLFFSALARVTAFDPNVWYTKRELIPFAHSLLLAALLCEQVTGTTQSASQLPEQARHRFWIDETNKEAWVEGKRVELTPQDFDLLLYLYQHAGQLCSRQAIVRTAFGVDYEEDEEIIERSRLNSAVSRLRQKLEPDPENPRYLTTVRGQGYKLLL